MRGRAALQMCVCVCVPTLAAPAGVVARPVVQASADWFVTSLDVLREALPRYRVAMIGSGEPAGRRISLLHCGFCMYLGCLLPWAAKLWRSCPARAVGLGPRADQS